MTNPNHTLIAALIDRSGSMASIKDDTEGGLKSFLESQRNDLKEGESIEVWLADFDNEFRMVTKNTNIHDVPEYTLQPRGMTALVDGMYRLINEVGNELSQRPEELRPGKVIFMTMTDGHENASKEHTADQLRAKVEDQKYTYGWNFIFLGANIDAVQIGTAYGIDHGAAMTYKANPEGVEATFGAVSRYSTMVRASAPAYFTDEDRSSAMQGEPVAAPEEKIVAPARKKSPAKKTTAQKASPAKKVASTPENVKATTTTTTTTTTKKPAVKRTTTRKTDKA